MSFQATQVSDAETLSGTSFLSLRWHPALPLRVMVSITCHKCLWLFSWHLSIIFPLSPISMAFDSEQPLMRSLAVLKCQKKWWFCGLCWMNTMPWGGQPVRRNCRWMLFCRGAVDFSQCMTRIVGAKDLRYPNTPEKTAAGTSLNVMNMLSDALGITEQARRKYLVLPLENVGTKIVYENCFQPCPFFGKNCPPWQTQTGLANCETTVFDWTGSLLRSLCYSHSWNKKSNWVHTDFALVLECANMVFAVFALFSLPIGRRRPLVSLECASRFW